MIEIRHWSLDDLSNLRCPSFRARLRAGLATLCVAFGSAHASSLSDAATKMPPGTWAVLSTNGFSGVLDNGGSGDVLSYSDSAMWDSTRREFFFMGSPHCGGAGNCQKFISYSEATNTWSSCTGTTAGCPAVRNDNGHGYDHNTVDPDTGIWYRRAYGSEQVWKRTDRSTAGAWSDITPMNHGYTQVAGGLAFFPELYNNSGGMVFSQGGFGEVHLWNKSQDQWTQVATGLSMGPYHNFAEYNPVHQMVLFGGGNGSRAIYKVASNGAITPMGNAPIDVGILSSIVTVDPVSGAYLVLAKEGQFYSFDPASNVWSRLDGGNPPPVLVPAVTPFPDIVASPIAEYGVVMFVRYNFANSAVYLYKHSPSSGVPVASPMPPVALSAN